MEQEPRLWRRGLVAATAVSAVAGLVALAGSALGGDPAPAPYGVAGCDPADAAGPVDVTVRAHALGAGGRPAASLGGSELQVGASVRDLAGYAAHGVAACDVVQVTVHLHDATGGGSVDARLEPADDAVPVDGGGGGRLVALDWSSWTAALPEGARAGEEQDRAAWLVTLVDPEPGGYRLVGRVSARDDPSAAGEVEVLVDVAPAAAG